MRQGGVRVLELTLSSQVPAHQLECSDAISGTGKPLRVPSTALDTGNPLSALSAYTHPTAPFTDEPFYLPLCRLPYSCSPRLMLCPGTAKSAPLGTERWLGV